MKISLYNIYKQLILEAVDLHTAQNAMNKNYGVNIVYQKKDKDGRPLKNSSNMPRWCQILAIGKTSKGHDAIRVYQISGPNLRANKKTGKVEKYKTFILNNIAPEDFRVSKFPFYSPPDGLFNAFGDKTLNVTSSSGSIATFGDKYMDNYRQRHSNWQSNLKTRQTNEPKVKDRADSGANAYTDFEYNQPDNEPTVDNKTGEPYIPYEKPKTNNDYQDDNLDDNLDDNPNDENI
jgi:hypothetical protein